MRPLLCVIRRVTTALHPHASCHPQHVNVRITIQQPRASVVVLGQAGAGRRQVVFAAVRRTAKVTVQVPVPQILKQRAQLRRRARRRRCDNARCARALQPLCRLRPRPRAVMRALAAAVWRVVALTAAPPSCRPRCSSFSSRACSPAKPRQRHGRSLAAAVVAARPATAAARSRVPSCGVAVLPALPPLCLTLVLRLQYGSQRRQVPLKQLLQRSCCCRLAAACYSRLRRRPAPLGLRQLLCDPPGGPADIQTSASR
jgi:hypothetical protein